MFSEQTPQSLLLQSTLDQFIPYKGWKLYLSEGRIENAKSTINYQFLTCLWMLHLIFICLLIYIPFNISSPKQLNHVYVVRALCLGFVWVRRTETTVGISKSRFNTGIGYVYIDGKLKEHKGNIEVSPQVVVTSGSSSHSYDWGNKRYKVLRLPRT